MTRYLSLGWDRPCEKINVDLLRRTGTFCCGFGKKQANIAETGKGSTDHGVRGRNQEKPGGLNQRRGRPKKGKRT